MRTRFVSVLGLALLAALPLACKSANGNRARLAGTEAGLEATPAPSENPNDPQKTYRIDRRMQHGDFFEVAVDATRQIEQITCKYDGRYTVKELDEDGKERLNDEGKTRFKDGMYAHGYVLGEDGEKREIAPKKFIDEGETDNWHDLYQAKGGKLRVEFRHGDGHAEDADVKSAATTIGMESIIVRYADAPGLVFQEFLYNPEYEDSMSKKAVAVKNNASHKVKLDKAKKVYRIDIRWGDEKPRDAAGIYIPGTASGVVKVNGQDAGTWRNVAAIETQVWMVNDYPVASGAENEVEIEFGGDDARIHWIKVYYQP